VTSKTLATEEESMSGGPTGDRLIRVDMSEQTVRIEPFPDEWKLLGGRALSARILLQEWAPTTCS
jgi:aldehyde:ferredoxin oxidoreductase